MYEVGVLRLVPQVPWHTDEREASSRKYLPYHPEIESSNSDNDTKGACAHWVGVTV